MPVELQLIRWTLGDAANNFDIDRGTLSKRMKVKGILPGADGLFSTMQICDAKYSNAEDARTELYQEQAELTKVKKMKLSGVLVYAEQVEKLWSAAIIDIRQKILDSEMPPKEKESLLKEIREIPIEEYAIEIAPDPSEDSEEVSAPV